MLNTETGNDNVDDWNEEDENEDNIIENVSSSLLVLYVDVHCPDDQEQNANDHLKSIYNSVRFYSSSVFEISFHIVLQ